MKLHHNFYYRPHAFVGFVSLGVLFFLFAAFLAREGSAANLDVELIQYHIAQEGIHVQR